MSSLPATEVFERFDIDLDAGDDPVFHGGELITGSLKINLRKQITIKVIRIQFKGRACWLGDAAKGAEIEKVYFDKDFILLERPPGRPEPGHFPWVANFTYSLPFQCPLPKGCPTSYEGPQGFIRYFARATLITDEVDATQYFVKKGITIISPPELHELLPPHSEPIEVEETATYGSCCCRGKVVARIELPKTAYAPGEKVIGTFTLNGKQPKQILEQIEVRLVDKVTRADIENEGSHKSKSHHKSGTMDSRTIYVRKLQLEDLTNTQNQKGPVSLSNIHLLTIPPVVPSTQRPTFPSPLLSPEIKLEPDGQVSRLLESPSTGTLKQRKKPFLMINYLIQISAGNKIVIDIPITIHPIPLYENGIEFQPFAAGIQNFHEADETDKKPLNAPFKYQPKYPIYAKSPAPVVSISNEPDHEMIVTPNGDVELSRSVEISELPNGDRVILSREEMVIVHNEERSPDSQRHSIHKRVLPDEEPPIRIAPKALERVKEVSPSPPVVVEEHHHHHHEHHEYREESHHEEQQPQQESYEENYVSERKEPSPIPVVEITPSEDQPRSEDEAEEVAYNNGIQEEEGEEEESSVVIREDDDAIEDGISRPYIQTEEENGHVITTEDFEDGDAKTHKTVETYEYTDENGVRVEVQKTTESTVVHHEEQSAH